MSLRHAASLGLAFEPSQGRPPPERRGVGLNRQTFPFFRAGNAFKFLFSGKRFWRLPEKDGSQTRCGTSGLLRESPWGGTGRATFPPEPGEAAVAEPRQKPSLLYFSSLEFIHLLSLSCGAHVFEVLVGGGGARGRRHAALPREEVWPDDPPTLSPSPGAPL